MKINLKCKYCDVSQKNKNQQKLLGQMKLVICAMYQMAKATKRLTIINNLLLFMSRSNLILININIMGMKKTYVTLSFHIHVGG
jgi:hypothetical protein